VGGARVGGPRGRDRGARLEIDEETERCAVTTVNPNTGARDLETLKLLRSHAGHINMGVYAAVKAGGRIAVGDSVAPPG